MGTIAQKLTYLDGTKQALKTSINNIGGSITNETTFREYAEELDNIYDNLPKTTGESSNLSLTTLKGKMNIIPKGDTQQDGTPTPDTPIDIEVVTGTQEVKVENKNIFNHNAEKKSAYPVVNVGSEVSYSNSGASSTYVNCCYVESGKSYTISYEKNTPASTGSRQSVIVDKNNIELEALYLWLNSSSSISFTPSHSGYLVLCVDNNSTDIQLEVGSATTYTPHQEQTQIVSLGDIELCKIGTYQDYLYKSNGNWYKKEYIGKYTFTGNENWFKHSTTSNNLFYISPVYNPIVSNMKKPSTNNVALECYSEMAQYKAVNTMAENSVIGINPSVAGDIYVGTSLSGISDRDVFKTYLQNHITNFYYLLENSNDIQITNTTLIEQLDNLEKMKSYNGTTNISSSGNLPMVLGVSAIKGE